jgi:hypothetical protein
MAYVSDARYLPGWARSYLNEKRSDQARQRAYEASQREYISLDEWRKISHCSSHHEPRPSENVLSVSNLGGMVGPHKNYSLVREQKKGPKKDSSAEVQDNPASQDGLCTRQKRAELVGQACTSSEIDYGKRWLLECEPFVPELFIVETVAEDYSPSCLTSDIPSDTLIPEARPSPGDMFAM